MPVLKPDEYNASYFDGVLNPPAHPAGYSNYERGTSIYAKTGLDYWGGRAKKLVDRFGLRGKKVLELGCAKGFCVESLRKFDVEAYGIDVSKYAIESASDSISRFLYCGDVLTTSLIQGKFDLIFSLAFLDCIAEEDVPALVEKLNEIAFQQYHEIRGGNHTHYNSQPLEWWSGFQWKNTILLSEKDQKEIICQPQ